MHHDIFFLNLISLKKLLLIPHYVGSVSQEYSWNHNLRSTELNSSKHTTDLLFQDTYGICGKDLTRKGGKESFFKM